MSRIKKILLLLGLLLGFGIIAYPFVATAIANRNQAATAMNVSTAIQDTEPKLLDAVLQECIAYNRTLSGVPSMFNSDGTLRTTSEDDYLNLLDFGNGAMGTLEIPKLELELPIYHGTTNEIISKGVGHLFGSSLPIGGLSTHAVLVSHSGLSNATLFTHLDELNPGDIVYVHVLSEAHAYIVSDKQIIEPEQVDSLGISEDKDILTLVTCYPVTVNTHRLLVNCERDESLDTDDKERIGERNNPEKENNRGDSTTLWNAVNEEERDYDAEREANRAAITIAACIGSFFVLALIVLLRENKKRGND